MAANEEAAKMYFMYSESHSGFIAEIWIQAFLNLAEMMQNKEFEAFIINQRRTNTMYVSKSFERIANMFSESKFTDSSFRKEFLSKSLEERNRLESLYKQVSDTNIKIMPNSASVNIITEYESSLRALAARFYLSQAEFTENIKTKIERGLHNYFSEKEIPQAIGKLLALPGLDILKREEIDLIKMAIKGYDSSDIETHTLKYSILFYNSYNRETIFGFIKEKLQKLSILNKEELEMKLEEIKTKVAEVEKSQSSLIRRIKNNELLNYILFLRDIGLDRLELKNSWAGAEYRFLTLFEEISNRLGIPLEILLSVYRFEDLKKALLNDIMLSEDEIEEREKISTGYFNKGDIRFLSGEQAQQLAEKKIPIHFVKKSVDLVKGVVANHGIVKGKARVLKVIGIEELAKDLKEFEDGEILITSMTQPNMVLIAKKASAIVTNEGGITSHAAVISREFGIPCVVGTHIATEIFKTGDLIEVDANKGIVRKVEG